MNTETWEFKVGDFVLLDASRYSVPDHSKHKVVRVTPSGQIQLELIPNTKFKQNGREIGSSDTWNMRHIFPWDESRHAKLVYATHLHQIRMHLRQLNWLNVKDEVIEDIFELSKHRKEAIK